MGQRSRADEIIQGPLGEVNHHQQGDALKAYARQPRSSLVTRTFVAARDDHIANYFIFDLLRFLGDDGLCLLEVTLCLDRLIYGPGRLLSAVSIFLRFGSHVFPLTLRQRQGHVSATLVLVECRACAVVHVWRSCRKTANTVQSAAAYHVGIHRDVKSAGCWFMTEASDSQSSDGRPISPRRDAH